MMSNPSTAAPITSIQSSSEPAPLSEPVGYTSWQPVSMRTTRSRGIPNSAAESAPNVSTSTTANQAPATTASHTSTLAIEVAAAPRHDITRPLTRPPSGKIRENPPMTGRVRSRAIEIGLTFSLSCSSTSRSASSRSADVDSDADSEEGAGEGGEVRCSTASSITGTLSNVRSIRQVRRYVRVMRVPTAASHSSDRR